MRNCKRCGTERPAAEWYPPRADGKEQGWCKPCYREWHRGRYATKSGADDEPRNCKRCGMSYRPATRRPSVYCSRACKDRACQDALIAERAASKFVRKCLQCAAEIGPERRSDAIFCSARCNESAHMMQRKFRARTGDQTKMGWIRAAVFERDRWRCGICGGAVGQQRTYPDPLCGSLDHIVPVSQGGGNEATNLRLTHLRCNVARRNRGGNEQLAIL